MYHPKQVTSHPVDAEERLRRFLRSAHPGKTAEGVAARTRIKSETVAHWLKGYGRPGFVSTLRLIGAYGPDLLAALLASPPAWLDHAAQAEQLRELGEQAADVARRLEALRRP